MLRHLITLSLALVAPAVLLQGCGGPLATAEVENARITSTDVPFESRPGETALGEITADLGPVGGSFGSGFTTLLTIKQVRIAWSDPDNHPDFSGVTSATLTVIPDPASGLSETVVASYVQDPGNLDPAELVIVGDPDLNVFDYLSGGVLTLRLDASGTAPVFPPTSATVVADLALKVEYSM